jgi:hypothetical protein
MNRPDSRALFAAACAVVALPVSWNPFLPLAFGPIGVLAAVASLTVAPVSRRTQMLALIAVAVCLVFFAVGLYGLLAQPSPGGG